ncbi:MAG: hypothetical protein GY839_19975 [candidate division Zixibacteria bacterium]|nr:hypothetical protein [candidate division Zixibacteria bacterium]
MRNVILIILFVAIVSGCGKKSTEPSSDIIFFDSFENFAGRPELSGWEWVWDEGTLVYDAPAGGGLWSLELHSSPYIGEPGIAIRELNPPQEDGIYRFSAWVKSDCEASIHWLIRTGNDNYQMNHATTFESGWTMISITDTLSLEGCDLFEIVLTAGCDSSVGPNYFDMVKLEKLD